MIKRFNANKARLKRHLRMRNRLEGTATRPRLSVFRSDLHIYAQVIDDATGKTLVAGPSLPQRQPNMNSRYLGPRLRAAALIFISLYLTR